MKKYQFRDDDIVRYLSIREFVLIGVIILSLISFDVLIYFAIRASIDSGYYFGVAFIISLFLFLIILALCPLIIHAFQNAKYRKVQFKINEDIKNVCKKKKINFDEVVYINDVHTAFASDEEKQFIAIDNENKRIILPDYDSCAIYVCEFDEVQDFKHVDDIDFEPNNYTIFVPHKSFVVPVRSSSGFSKILCKQYYFLIKIKGLEEEIVYAIVTDYFGGVSMKGKRYAECFDSVNKLTTKLTNIINSKSQK